MQMFSPVMNPAFSEQKNQGALHSQRPLAFVAFGLEGVKIFVEDGFAEGAQLDRQGRGLIFSLPVDEVAGIVHLLDENSAGTPE